MRLSAFGVESDTYPSIAATLNFKHHTSRCERSYYNPAYPSSTYQLSTEEMRKVQQLLQQANLAKLKPNYSTTRTDQPTSTIVICTTSQTFTIKDYGLEGDAPLSEIYHLVYKLEH
jgi:hypothetical protein